MNDPLPIQIGLKIPTHPDEIHEYTNQVLKILAEHVSLTEVLKKRIRLILIELVTNSIKHSTDPDALIRLTINHPQLTIEKVDIGLQIRFKGPEQIPFEEVDKIIKISFSENNNYHINILDKYKFKFIDSFNEEMSIENFPEHFGLYIVTVASDSFEYQHDPELQENTFIVNINL